MRNLKKVLSLALALVMLLGMMMVGAGAATTGFEDDAKISDSFKEAAAVNKALGIMEGDGTNLNPTGKIVRAEAFILSLRVDGNNTDAIAAKWPVTEKPFNDVSTGKWYAHYLAYGKEMGLIKGSNGNYNPDTNITVVEYSILLLGKLGFDPARYQGAGWNTNAASDALEIGLYDGLGNVNYYTHELTRQEACQMVFNAITKYSPSGAKGYTVEGGKPATTVAFGSMMEAMLYQANQTEKGTIKESVASDTLAVSKFGLSEGTTVDAFGRTVKTWEVKGEKDPVYISDKPVGNPTVYTSKQTLKDLKFVEGGAEVYVDSAKANEEKLVNGDDAKLNALTGNGVTVEVYANDKVIYKVVVMSSFIGEVSKVTEAKGDAKRFVTVGSDKFETEEFDEGDVVVYTKADKKVQTMALAEVVEDVEVTKLTGDTKATIGGKEYTYAEVLTDKTDIKVDATLNLYLDGHGYLAMVDPVKGVSAYAYVIEIGSDSDRYDTDTKYFAKLLLTDGTTVEGQLSKTTVGEAKDKTDLNKTYQGKVVEFEKNNKDLYTLKDKSLGADKEKTITITRGNAKMTFGSDTVYADKKTVFLVKNGNSYDVYTGYDEVPTLAGTEEAKSVYSVGGEAGIAKVVYLEKVNASTKDVVFVLGLETDPANIKITGADYYEYPAVINGEVTTIRLNDTTKENKLWSSIAYEDKNNEIVDVAAGQDVENKYTVTGTIDKALKNGVVTIEKEPYAVDDEVQVYVCTDKKITAAGIRDVADGDTCVIAVLTDGKITSLFYEEKKEEQKPSDNVDKVDVSDVTVELAEGSSWNNAAKKDDFSDAIEVTLKFKSTVDAKDYEEKAIAAVAAAVTAKKGWTYTEEFETGDTNYVLTFKDRNDVLRYVVFAKTLVATDETNSAKIVVETKTADEVAEALADENDNVEIVVNASVELPAEADISKPMTIAKGATVTLPAETEDPVSITAPVTGEGALAVPENGKVNIGYTAEKESDTVKIDTVGKGAAVTVESGKVEIAKELPEGATLTVTEGADVTVAGVEKGATLEVGGADGAMLAAEGDDEEAGSAATTVTITGDIETGAKVTVTKGTKLVVKGAWNEAVTLGGSDWTAGAVKEMGAPGAFFLGENSGFHDGYNTPGKTVAVMWNPGKAISGWKYTLTVGNETKSGYMSVNIPNGRWTLQGFAPEGSISGGVATDPAELAGKVVTYKAYLPTSWNAENPASSTFESTPVITVTFTMPAAEADG